MKTQTKPFIGGDVPSSWDFNKIDLCWNEWTTDQRLAVTWFGFVAAKSPNNQLAIDIATVWLNTLFSDAQATKIADAIAKIIAKPAIDRALGDNATDAERDQWLRTHNTITGKPL